MGRADELNDRGWALLEEGRLDEGAALLQEAIEAAPDWPIPWYHLGLAHKWRHRWHDCMLANRRAAELAGDAGQSLLEDPACWNLGIAATAVGAWDVALWAWRSYGIEIEGEGRIDGNFGLGVVRLNPDGSGEVVYGRRLDPARMRIVNVPLPESGHRYGDIVLHDGEPKGKRTFNGRDISVFDELERLEPSSIPTTVVGVWCAEPADVEALFHLTDPLGGFEDWTSSMELICRACSTGEAGVNHDHDRLRGEWQPERKIALAVSEAEVEPLLARWRAAAPADRIVSGFSTES